MGGGDDGRRKRRLGGLEDLLVSVAPAVEALVVGVDRAALLHRRRNALHVLGVVRWEVRRGLETKKKAKKSEKVI